MLKPIFLLAGLLAFCAAPASPGMAQEGGLYQPFTSPAATPQPGPGLPMLPTGDAVVPLDPAPPAPATILRPLTAARPVVVELFTAEGCASCPPADHNLSELAQRRDLLALTYHVDYWDYTGWPDRFATAVNGARQRAYATAMGDNMLYTPQVLVAGALPVLGSDRVAIEAALRAARNRKVMAELVLARDAGGDLQLRLPAMALSVPASLWLVTFSFRDQSDVTAGENNGRRLVSVNTVRSLRKLGEWNGAPFAQSIRLTPEELAGSPDGGAIIANEAEFGPVVAAAAWQIADLR